jgi:hypothetical protein
MIGLPSFARHDKMFTQMTKNIIWPLLFVVAIACNRTGVEGSHAFAADAVMQGGFPGAPRLTGRLYLNDRHVRIDWEPFVDVFDLTQRIGWRIDPGTQSYAELVDKDLSTYAPEMTNGSVCPHANVPSACKFVRKEEMNGRTANKWDLLNPHGFHVYFWTDDKLEVTLRCDIGNTVYNVTNLRKAAVDKTVFEIPSGYKRVARWW